MQINEQLPVMVFLPWSVPLIMRFLSPLISLRLSLSLELVPASASAIKLLITIRHSYRQDHGC